MMDIRKTCERAYIYFVDNGTPVFEIKLRNNISQTVILLLNNITVWSSDAGNYITRA
jgi:hypothetical protein